MDKYLSIVNVLIINQKGPKSYNEGEAIYIHTLSRNLFISPKKMSLLCWNYELSVYFYDKGWWDNLNKKCKINVNYTIIIYCSRGPCVNYCLV